MNNMTNNHWWMIKTAAMRSLELVCGATLLSNFFAHCGSNMSTQPIMISSKISSNVMRIAAVLILYRWLLVTFLTSFFLN